MMVRTTATWVVLLLLFAGDMAHGRVWHVRKDGTGDYTVIQDAVDHAAAGDTVMIGPGRYEEKRPYTSYAPEKWTFDVYVAVDVSDLTIIGSGDDQTIIGPLEPIWQSPQEPKIICALSGVSRLVVEDLLLENVHGGIYRDQGGTLAVRRCTIRRCQGGIVSWSELGTQIEDCQFIENTERGVSSWYPACNVIIERCVFEGSGTYADQTAGVYISECHYQGGTTGATLVVGSNGSISDCSFTGIANAAIVVRFGSNVALSGNTVLGGAANLVAWDAGTVVTGTGNAFGGGGIATVRIRDCSVTMHGNHILHGIGPSVYLEYFASEPIRYLDFTNNYWGTASADSIASWIHDRRDDRTIYAYVQFQPFSPGVIRAEQKSLGSVKNLYR